MERAQEILPARRIEGGPPVHAWPRNARAGLEGPAAHRCAKSSFYKAVVILSSTFYLPPSVFRLLPSVFYLPPSVFCLLKQLLVRIPCGPLAKPCSFGRPGGQGWPSPRSRVPAGLGTAFPLVPEDSNLLFARREKALEASWAALMRCLKLAPGGRVRTVPCRYAQWPIPFSPPGAPPKPQVTCGSIREMRSNSHRKRL